MRSPLRPTDPLPLYTLAYHLLNGGARRARRLSAQYYLALPDTPNQDRLQNDLRLLRCPR
ncbi:MAG: hypothetical protein R2857_02330 [Vampirovibrionales bacterium]